jgi:hypothetical protein
MPSEMFTLDAVALNVQIKRLQERVEALEAKASRPNGDPDFGRLMSSVEPAELKPMSMLPRLAIPPGAKVTIEFPSDK